MPAGARLRNAPLSHPGPALHPGPDLQGAVAGPRGAQTRHSQTCPPGPRTGKRWPARSPAFREGLAQRSVAAHLKAQLDWNREAEKSVRAEAHGTTACPAGHSLSLPERVFKSPRPHAAASPSAARKSGPLLRQLHSRDLGLNRATGKAGRREW